MTTYSRRHPVIAGFLHSSIAAKSAARHVFRLVNTFVAWAKRHTAAYCARRQMLAMHLLESRRAGVWGSGAEAKRMAALSCQSFSPFRID
jgi:hypothetical protein